MVEQRFSKSYSWAIRKATRFSNSGSVAMWTRNRESELVIRQSRMPARVVIEINSLPTEYRTYLEIIQKDGEATFVHGRIFDDMTKRDFVPSIGKNKRLTKLNGPLTFLFACCLRNPTSKKSLSLILNCTIGLF